MAYPFQPAAPVPAKSNTLRTVLIVVGVVLAVVLAACAVGGYFLFKSVNNAAAPARDAAVTFVGDLEAGNNDGAYGLLCASTQQSFTSDAFTAGLAKQSKLSSHQVLGTAVSNFNGRVTATVTMSLTDASGFTSQHAFTMVKEGGAWKVCGAPY